MKTKTYIAVILTFVFLAKFVAVDAHGLNIIFSGSDITFVNPNCEKFNSSKDSNDNPSMFMQQDNVNTQMVALNVNCTSLFQFELFSWESKCLDLIEVLDEHFTSTLSYRYLDNVSPPPRSA